VAGENLKDFLAECSVRPPFCTVNSDTGATDCGSDIAARLFFYSYILLSAYLLFSLLAAVIIENYGAVFMTMQASAPIQQRHLERCECPALCCW
jgi:hypothetical protein